MIFSSSFHKQEATSMKNAGFHLLLTYADSRLQGRRFANRDFRTQPISVEVRVLRIPKPIIPDSTFTVRRTTRPQRAGAKFAALAQGTLTPPGSPVPTMKSFGQITPTGIRISIATSRSANL